MQMNALSGYKTYIIAGLVIIVTGLKGAGIIDDAMFQSIVTILGAFGLWTLRAGVTKSGPTK